MAKTFNMSMSIAAVLASGFTSTFNKANKHIEKSNKLLIESQQIWRATAKAQYRGILSTEKANNVYTRLSRTIEKIPKMQSEFGRYAENLGKSYGHLLIGKNIGDWFYSAAQPAMQFESAMADVKKVVDFDTPQQFKQMSKDIVELSTKIPMTAEGLAQIVAAGGQSGIARQDLTAFAESAAKMGVAFDITADQAGEMMAKWRTAFKMNQSAVVELADKVNYLGNTTAASAPLISDVITRVGPLGEVGGVASGEIAALGASLVGSGVNSEIAATGIKNLILGLTAGASATKSQSAAFQRLGFDTVDLSKHMQQDARGAIISVLKAVQGLSKEEQASTLKEMFGKESLGAIAPLLSNLEGLEKNFDAVGDASKYTGSMQAEFDARSDTTANKIQLMENRLEKAKIQMGGGFLPVITVAAEKIGAFASVIGDFAAENPNLIAALTGTAGALTSVYIATSIGMTAFNAYKAMVVGGKIAIDTLRNSTIIYNGIQKAFSIGTKIMAAAQLAFNFALSLCPIGWLIIGIGLVVAAGIVLYQNWDYVSEKMSAAWETIKNAFAEGWKWIEEKWNNIKNLLSVPIFGKINLMAEGAKANVDHNATGGIYGKGAFLTTFAEDSGESAIPHTPNAHNIGLLARTNEIMGNPLGGGGGITATFAPQITVTGNTDVGQINDILQDKMREFESMLKRLQSQERRLSYV